MSECTGIQVGQKVPDFKMATFDPKSGGFGEFSLAENMKAGKWTILFFYPADFTFVCATEFAALAERYDDLTKLGAEVVTVSTDTQFTHLAWHREEKELEKARFLMGADPTGEVSRLFGVYLQDSGLALRGTFLIDPDGTLQSCEVNNLNVGRNIDELVRKMKAFRYVKEHGDEVCPANWDEGKKTLKPGPELVGRVHQALHS